MPNRTNKTPLPKEFQLFLDPDYKLHATFQPASQERGPDSEACVTLKVVPTGRSSRTPNRTPPPLGDALIQSFAKLLKELFGTDQLRFVRHAANHIEFRALDSDPWSIL